MKHYTVKSTDRAGNHFYAVYTGPFQRLTEWMTMSELVEYARRGNPIGQYLYW